MTQGAGNKIIVLTVFFLVGLLTLAALAHTAENPFHLRVPAYKSPSDRTVKPSPSVSKDKKPERRGKYANPYDRTIPLQGDSHEEYKGGKKDPYQRAR